MRRMSFAAGVAAPVMLSCTDALAAPPGIMVLRSPTHRDPRRSCRSHDVSSKPPATIEWE